MTEAKFLNYLIQVLHYNYVRNYAKKNKIKLHCSDFSKNLLFPNWREIANYYTNYIYPFNKIQRVLRRIIKLIYFNKHLPVYKIILGLLKRKKNLSLGSLDKVKKAYILKSNLFYKHIDWIDLFDKGLKKKVEKKY